MLTLGPLQSDSELPQWVQTFDCRQPEPRQSKCHTNNASNAFDFTEVASQDGIAPGDLDPEGDIAIFGNLDSPIGSDINDDMNGTYVVWYAKTPDTARACI
jgi:hypothetical protein